jgi:hypothetical protein
VSYRIVRKYQDDSIPDEVRSTGLSLEEAKEHCNSEESSSRTCSSGEGVTITTLNGSWFDVFYEE